eukprot:1159682-Pelagomonas_calceolata.AAC.5
MFAVEPQALAEDASVAGKFWKCGHSCRSSAGGVSPACLLYILLWLVLVVFPCQPQRFPDDMGDRVGFVVSGADVPKDGVVMSVPESLAVTRIDAVPPHPLPTHPFSSHTEDHELVGGIAAQSSELTALTLLLLAERAKGDSSPHSSLFASLPVSDLFHCCSELHTAFKEYDSLPVRDPCLVSLGMS